MHRRGTRATGLATQSMLLSRAFYFFYFAAGASFFPYLALRYEQLGIAGARIGLLVAIPQLTTLVGASFWGGLADAAQQHGRLLRVAIIAVIAMTLVLSQVTGFWLLIPVVALLAFCGTPIMPLMDNSVLDLLGERRDQYGKLRLWGAVGWGIAAPIVGRLVEYFGLTVPFYGYALLMLGGLIVSSRLSVSHTSIGQDFRRGLRLLAVDPRWLSFLLFLFVGGMTMSVVHNYLFLYLEDIGASNSLMGLSLTVATLGEMSIFWFSDRLLLRLGTRRLLVAALLAHVVRVSLYSVLRVPWLVLPVQLLHGLAFSAMWVACVSYANQLAPEGMGATAQGLLNSVFFGLGGALGALSGGLVYERFGFAVMFRLAAVLGLLGVLLFAVTSRWQLSGSREALSQMGLSRRRQP
jgi:PPP family 3-phenylpropionic acid transporter